MYQKIESGGTRVPDSYRVTPDSSDVDLMTVIGQQLASEPGVLSVTDVSDSVKTVTGVSNFARRAMLVVGIGLLVAALLLILNAIRMAMFARRREIEVMKLVGATNWFIRVPFMLEGIIQGLVGSAAGAGRRVRRCTASWTRASEQRRLPGHHGGLRRHVDRAVVHRRRGADRSAS